MRLQTWGTQWPAAILLASCIAGCATPLQSLRHFETNLEHGARCAAIEVAAATNFSGDRAKALVPIASLTDLSEHEQVFLVEATIASAGFSSDVTAVLVALALNPSLTISASSTLARLQHEANLFSSDRKQLADALGNAHARR